MSPERFELVEEVREKIKLDYTPLSDANGEAMRRFRLAFAMDDDLIKQYQRFGADIGGTSPTGRWELPAPGTFVVDQSGVIRFAFADWVYAKRAKIEDILEVLREMQDDS